MSGSVIPSSLSPRSAPATPSTSRQARSKARRPAPSPPMRVPSISKRTSTRDSLADGQRTTKLLTLLSHFVTWIALLASSEAQGDRGQPMANIDILSREGCDPSQHIWSRRNFIGLAAWGTVLGSLGVGTVAFGRFMYPRVLYEPNTVVKLGKPGEYKVNEVSERWIKIYRLWIMRYSDGLAALYGKCTHLGCTP